MSTCGICLQNTSNVETYHPACLEKLFGVKTLPILDGINLRTLYQLASEMAGKMSISGAQEKVSLSLSPDKTKLQVSPRGGRFILKPEPARYSSVPQNEHVTMLMASQVGIETPPFGLVWLKDASPAYIIKRFDRLDNGRKLHVEDFCQLSELPIKDKYKGSGEMCVRILQRFASEPLIEIRKLFKILLFTWWVANGDHHLKNLSLMTGPNGIVRLTPAYDLLCTRLVIPRDKDPSLTIDGKKAKLTRATWQRFADYCGLSSKVVERLLVEQIETLGPATSLIQNSFLPDDLKATYIEIITENSNTLSI